MELKPKHMITGGPRVTITRLWHRPEIHTRVSLQGIQLELPLEDFLEALSQELSWLTWVTRAQLAAAAEKVVEGVKQESAKVVQ